MAGYSKGWLVQRLLAAAFLFACLEGVIFHGLYAGIIEPESTTGWMEELIKNEIRRPKLNANQVLAVGHSRQALRARITDEMNPSTGYTFATIGLGGTTARVWYYALRAVDPNASNYAAILIPEDDYNEPDTWEDQSERSSDIHYLAARLRMKDLFEYPMTYREPKNRWTAFESILLKGTMYRADVLQFLDHPLARIEKAKWYDEKSASWNYDYGGESKTLAGGEIDWASKTAHFPANIPETEQKRIASELFGDRPLDQGHEAAYRLFWYRRILDRYHGTRTKVFFLRVPRAPISPPEGALKANSAVRQVASDPNAVVLDEHLLDSLERPELFFDALHLNREGEIQFSEIIAAAVRERLGPPAGS